MGWPLVAALAITIALVADRTKPFVHSRPKPRDPAQVSGTVDARLWQDPIATAPEIRSSPVSSPRGGFDRITLVTVPPGLRPQRVEFRCNTRHAMHDAMSTLGFVASVPALREYVALEPGDDRARPVDATTSKQAAARSPQSTPTRLYVESFHEQDGRNRRLVVWVPEERDLHRKLVDTKTLLRRRGLVSRSTRWAIVGPSSSELAEELVPLSREVYSPWATTPEAQDYLKRSFTPPDSDLAKSMLDELKLRGVRSKDPVLLVLERDSEYARRWLKHLQDQGSGDGRLTNIRTFYYSRGIDGEFTDRTQPNNQSAGNLATAVQDPCGFATADYLRRLRNRIRQGQEGTHAEASTLQADAVGIFGNDIHDKLLILQALRPALPGAVFFTSDLDAYYLDPDEQPHTRNLLVVSGRGLTPRGKSLIGSVAPYRNGYQTSAFHAFRAAFAPRQVTTRELPQVRVFEIGHGTEVDLSEAADNVAWFGMALAMLGIVLIGIVSYRLLGNHEEGSTAEWPSPSTRRCTLLALAAIAIATLIVMRVAEEPISWTRGISIWPTNVWRLLAITLALMFGLKVLRAIQEALEDLGANPPPSLFGELVELMTGGRWTPRPLYADARATRRVAVEAGVFAILIAAGVVAWLLVSGWTPPPARGQLARCWDSSVKFLGMLALLWLVVLVVQFARVQSARCRAVRSQIPRLVRAGRLGTTLDELATAGGKGIYGPFFVVLVLSLGRIETFERWTWPLALVALFVGSTLAIIVAHVALHRSAVRLQDKGTEYLKAQIVAAAAPPPRLVFKLGELTRMRHGILAGPANHPILVALLIPFSGMGGLSLIHMMQSPPF